MPSRLNASAAGQKPVNEAWIMLSPANTVSNNQYGLKSSASAEAYQHNRAGEGEHRSVQSHFVLLVWVFRVARVAPGAQKT